MSMTEALTNVLELKAVILTLKAAPAVDGAREMTTRLVPIAPSVIPASEVPPGVKSKVRTPVIGRSISTTCVRLGPPSRTMLEITQLILNPQL
jgi:hypothetical protein